MDDAVDTSRTIGDVSRLASSLWRADDGVTLAYAVLEQAASHRGVTDAYLVLRPEGMGPQLFRLGEGLSPDAVRRLAARPVGLYTEPDVIDSSTRSALGGICNLVLSADAARRMVAVDPESGLLSRSAIEVSLERAAACSARYGWRFTLVLLATAGEGEPSIRWRALSRALRVALRTGDEVGATGRGAALAVLGNAGPDVVRPFVARVRAALSADGAEGVELLAATASAPDETVDPSELTRLVWQRIGSPDGLPADDRMPPSSRAALELDLRAQPGVVCTVMSAAEVTVFAVGATESLRAVLTQRVGEESDTLALHLVDVAGDVDPAPRPAEPGDAKQNGTGLNGKSTPPATPPLLAAGAPGRTGGKAGDRVALLSARFDAGRGWSEVSLALGGARGTGRAPAGPLAGGAQATLTALGALGVELPYYLVSAERAHGVPGDPVVVVLAPRQAPNGVALAERIGVANGIDDVDAASRATLGALNRFLQKVVAVRPPLANGEAQAG